MADAADLLARAWQLSYLDTLAAGALGRQVAAAGGAGAAEGWLHVALAEIRAGDATLAQHALAQSRAAFENHAGGGPDARGLALCDEVQAIALRRAGDHQGAARLLAEVDARGAVQRDAMHSFLAHNSRAITAKRMGEVDEALRHFYAAADAAERTGWPGPRCTALCNLGGYHQHLFNLEEACTLSEQALAMAREAGAKQNVVVAACNLILIYYAAGQAQQSRAMVEYLLTHAGDLPAGALAGCPLPLALGHLAVGEIDTALAYLKPGAVGGVGDGDLSVMWAWQMARCLLARNEPGTAREVAHSTLRRRSEHQALDQPFDTMLLLRALADAAEQCGDTATALACLRQAHALYEKLVGIGGRARHTALQLRQQLAEAQRERDVAVSSRRSVEDDHRRLADLHAALQAQVAETEMLHAKLLEQALRDPLTGLHNRRHLFETAPGLLELARRQGSSLCVVLLDLDHFKLLNDTCGHPAGDLVLQRFSALLMQMLRRSDVVCRYGGEEFVAVMPDIDAQGAQLVLQRLLEAFQAQQSELGRRRLPRGSFSAGVALFPRHGHTLEQLLSRADRGLYAAKNQGRARIELAPQTGFGSFG